MDRLITNKVDLQGEITIKDSPIVVETNDRYWERLSKLLDKRAVEMESAKQKGDEVFTTKEVIHWVKERRERDEANYLE